MPNAITIAFGGGVHRSIKGATLSVKASNGNIPFATGNRAALMARSPAAAAMAEPTIPRPPTIKICEFAIPGLCRVDGLQVYR